MRCFVHQDIEAVGICRCCAKGTCAACAIPVTNGLACSSTCQPVAEEIAQLQLVGLRNQGIHRAQRMVQPVSALILLGYGLWTVYMYPSWFFGWIFAAGGLAIAASLVVSSRRRRAG